jgi:RNA polymerase sigma-70 factor (ECF subfamily)
MPPEASTLFDLGRAAWPTLGLAPTDFDRYVTRLEAEGTSPQEKYAADLYLACACATKVGGAVEAFERAHGNGLRRAMARIERSEAFVEEALQLVRIALFVAEPPVIGGYGGRAKLATWATTIATRTALGLRKARSGRSHEPIEGVAVGVAANLELDYVRERYRDDFRDAVRVAIERLSTKERALLRLHLGERLGIDRLAVVYGTPRSTVARWLATARATLMEEARREVQARLGVTPSELVEVGADLWSAIDVSLVRLLAPSGG